MLRIGIDGRCLARSAAGISRYVIELCRELDLVMPDVQFYVYSLEPVPMRMPSERWVVRGERSAVVRRLLSAAATTLPWYRFRVGSLCKLDGVSIFWGTRGTLPRVPPTVRTLLTVYDLTALLAPGTMSWRSFAGDRLLFKKSLGEANAICAISGGTAERLRDLLGYKTDAVVRPAVSAHFSPRGEDEIESVLRMYGVRPPYILCVGTWEPRKNLELLLRAFLGMKADGLVRDYKLVLVGGRGWKDEKLASLVKEAERDEVVALGYVPDCHMPALYSGAKVFVFPSIYEGFGIPVLEARACGVRVATTDIPELHEAGGDQCTYIPPTQEGIRTGILTAIESEVPDAQRTFVKPSWSDSARLMVSVFRALGVEDSQSSLRASAIQTASADL